MHNQDILNERLFKAVVRNDIKDIQRIIGLGADVNSEFTIYHLINNKVLDDGAITIIKNAETAVDKLAASRSHPFLGGAHMDDTTFTAILNKSYSKVIFIPIKINKIILSTESKLSPLQLSILYGWKKVIIELIKKGADPNKTLDIQGITILQLMCTAAVLKDKKCYIFDEEIVQLLFDYGADPNIQDILGKTFIFYAVQGSDFHIDEMVREKLKTPSDSKSDLKIDIERIKKYLVNGANPNIKNNVSHSTLLYDIVSHDSYLHIQPALTYLLLDHEAFYSTAEDILQHPEIISMMQEDYGQNYGFANAKDEVDKFNSKFEKHVQKNYQLIEAIKGKNKYKVSLLLNKGTSPNIRDKDGLSALHLAVKLDDYSITELLLDKGANPNIKSWKNGTTPLFNCATCNRINIAELLLKHNANPSVINTKGLSPLYFPVTNNNKEMKELLLKFNANPDISNQIFVLFNVLNELKKDNDIKIIENTLNKIKDIAEFLKSKNIPVDYSLFYQSVDIAEKKDKKNTAKKVMELLDKLTFSMS